ncbi:MAG: hypothetical protein WBL85_00110 [Sedimentisphaerales bacterium]
MVIIAILLAVASVPAAADDAMWTWVSGSNTFNPTGTNIIPGGREECVSWIDDAGNLWFFGGYGIGSDGSASLGLLNGLWKFDGTGWTLVKGHDMTNISYQGGVYGTEGSGYSNNTPGARSNSVSWTDISGNLWLFGGYGYDANVTLGLLNDLWKFDGSNWIWITGSNAVNQYGVYGTMGVANSNNTPGARGSSATWADSNGTLWLFGGYGYGSSGSVGALNDLWKYRGSKWIWVNGSKSISHKGAYGTEGVADANNVPGARYGTVLWMDIKGNLWVYGGYGYDSRGNGGYLSDSWKFDVDSNEWTWVSGSNRVNQHSAGVYGTQGEPNANNVPGDRMGAASWRDNYGYLWLFGGMGYDSGGTYGLLNDLWKFNDSVWEWVKGSDTVSESGTYGTQGIANSDNTPGARGYSVSCMDTSGNLWLFGGYGYDYLSNDGNLNDLWKFGSIIPQGVQLRVFCEANEITNGQSDPVILGTAPVSITGPSKTFTIRNNGSETLVLDVPFAQPTDFNITQPEESVLAPGDYTTFTVTLDTNEIGVFQETISFDNNDVDNDPFSFTIKGTVVQWEFGNIPGSKNNTKLTVPDVCGVSVTFSLTGGGYGEIVGDSNFSQVNLYGTGEKSQLTIAAKTEISVGDINSTGSLKAITAKTTNLRGNIQVSGSLASLVINDVNNSNTITIGSSSNPKATISLSFDRVADLTINSQMPVKAISATEWLGGAIDAPSIASITAKGNLDVNVTIDSAVGSIKTAGTLSGEWNCNTIKSVSALNITSATLALDQAPNAKVLALGTLTVKSYITDSQIISDGNIGTINAGAMINSVCFAGIKDGVTGLPDPNADINYAPPASIKSITVKGIKGEPNSFINSDIAAASILSATLNYPQSDNNGVPFGVSAGSIKSLKIKNTGGSVTLKNLNSPSDNNDFGDFKIRLY